MKKSMKNNVIIHIDMDAFFAAIEQRDNMLLRGKPVVIGADPKDGKGRGVVATCSYEARKFGIHSAMPISEAYRRCKSAYFLQGDMKKYKKVSNQIFELLYDFTDMLEPVSIDEAFLDITGSFHFYHSPFNTGKAIKDRIQKELNLNASIGIAPIKMAAKIASDLSKPNGLVEVKESEMLNFLWELPIDRLWGVGLKTKILLNKLAIFSIKDLALMDCQVLFKKLGDTGLHLHDLANGIDLRRVEKNEDIKSVSHEHTFDQDTNEVKELHKTISSLSQKVSRRLRKYGLKGKTIVLKIRTKSFHTVTRAQTLDLRTNHFDVIYSVSIQMFKRQYSLNEKIRLLGIKVSNLGDPYVLDNLFDDPQEVKREKVHAAIDQIKNKFGECSIQRGHL